MRGLGGRCWDLACRQSSGWRDVALTRHRQPDGHRLAEIAVQQPEHVVGVLPGGGLAWSELRADLGVRRRAALATPVRYSANETRLTTQTMTAIPSTLRSRTSNKPLTTCVTSGASVRERNLYRRPKCRAHASLRTDHARGPAGGSRPPEATARLRLRRPWPPQVN
jgi:hypothetical protein